MTINLHELVIRQAVWSQATFGSDAERGPIYPLLHLQRELEELLAEPHDVEEYADCVLLLLDALRRAGHSLDDLLTAMAVKHSVNITRTWDEPGNDGVIEHEREVTP